MSVELMDGNTLRASVSVAGVPADWAELPKETAALLVEFRAPDEQAQLAHEKAAAQVHGRTSNWSRPSPSVTNAFTRDAKTIGFYWKARKAFVSAVGGSRPAGTTLITEDFAVPPSRLAEACEALLELQRRHGFDAAVAGHAAHGNLHFLLAFDAAEEQDVARYAAFMDDFCRLTVERFDGSLKAEHATGRNIAPFLRAGVGRAGHGADVADQADRRPGRCARAARPAGPRPEGASARTEVHPEGGGGRPTPASSAASANRPAPAAT